jgi:hypothetical protein
MLSQFFKDGTGQLSSVRLIQFLIVVTVLSIFIVENICAIIIALKTSKFPVLIDFPIQSALLIAAVLGGKVAQTIFAETQGKDGDNGNE